jgi:hypothetical protein
MVMNLVSKNHCRREHASQLKNDFAGSTKKFLQLHGSEVLIEGG